MCRKSRTVDYTKLYMHINERGVYVFFLQLIENILRYTKNKKKKYSRKLLFSSAYGVNERYIQICRLINKQHGCLTIVAKERPLCFALGSRQVSSSKKLIRTHANYSPFKL